MNTKFAILATLTFTLVACHGLQTASKDGSNPSLNYSKVLAQGQPSLERVSISQWPDFGEAWEQRDLFLRDSLDNSIEWFEAPSSRQWFPMEEISHTKAKNSVTAIRRLLETSSTKEQFLSELEARFDVYRSVGCDDEGTVLFTGYYAPDFYASKFPTPENKSALHTRPWELVVDPTSGEPLGRKLQDGSVVPWPSRREIVTSGMFDGNELVWVRDDLDAYTIHVNGSARLRLEDGELMYIGYAGKTDRPYTGLGKSVLDAGLLQPSALSLRNIRRLYDRNPDQIKDLMYNNESYVFFKEYDGASWPAGSLGVQVTPRRSIATDKRIYPRGGIVLVDTTVKSLTGEETMFTQFMVDQDTGGAIRAPGRADLYMGVGPTAGIKAGNQYAEGFLYYIFLKSDAVAVAQH